MEVYVVEYIVSWEGSIPEVVYYDELDAKKHVEEFNKGKDLTEHSSDMYADYYIRELKDKFEGL